ncbi:MAG: hypothetical protein ABI442_03055 [Gemmatimonadaceae bacterium]
MSDAKRVGWICGDRIGFGGFADATQAAWAAAVAARALARREAERKREGPPSSAIPRLVLVNDGGGRWVEGDGLRLARLVPPGPNNPVSDATDGGSFAFEIGAADPSSDVTVMSSAHTVFRGLRRSGLPWRTFKDEGKRRAGTDSHTHETGDMR